MLLFHQHHADIVNSYAGTTIEILHNSRLMLIFLWVRLCVLLVFNASSLHRNYGRVPFKVTSLYTSFLFDVQLPNLRFDSAETQPAEHLNLPRSSAANLVTRSRRPFRLVHNAYVSTSAIGRRRMTSYQVETGSPVRVVGPRETVDFRMPKHQSLPICSS